MGVKRNLTRAQVRRIKRLYWKERRSQVSLAEEYGVSVSWVHCIVHDKAYVS